MRAGEKMNVAVITPNPTPYRTPFLRHLAASDELRVKVFFLTRGSATRPWKVDLDGFDHEFLDEYSLPVGGKDKARYRVNPGIFSRLRRGRFDVVVIAGYNHFTTQAAILYCILTRTPWCLMSESHVRKPRGAVRKLLKGLFLKPLLARMGAAMVTGTLARRYIESFGVPGEAVFTVANTPDVASLSRLADELAPQRELLRDRLGLTGKRVVLFVGRLLEEKGLAVLFEAYALVKAAQAAAALVIAGDGPKRAKYERLVEQRGLADVQFAGFRGHKELSEFYAAADVFVLPSLVEPWGVVVNEAMAAGLPVVLSDQVGASADLAAEGENGFVVPAGDAAALSQRILDVLSDDERRIEMGRCSRRIISRWDYRASAANFISAARTAVARGGRAID